MPSMLTRRFPVRMTRLMCCALLLLVTAADLAAQPEAFARTAEVIATSADTSEAATPRPSPEDRVLTARLRRVYDVLGGLDHVEARAQDGVVLLTGEAADAMHAEEAAAVAAAQPETRHVVNRVTVGAASGERLQFFAQSLERLWAQTKGVAPVGLAALLLAGIFALLGAWVSRGRWLSRRWSSNPLLGQSVQRLLGAVVMLAGLAVGLEMAGLTSVVGAVLGAAGLFGLTLGFALKDIIENYLAGMLLSIRSPFSIDDMIRVGDHEGVALRMNARELVLLTLDGNHIRLPNAYAYMSVITNYTRNPLRSFHFTVGVGVEEDLREVQRVGLEALGLMPGVAKDPAPAMRVADLAAYSVDVLFLGWVDQRTHDFLKVESEAKRVVKTALDAAGVEMPWPQQTVHLRRTEPGDTPESASPRPTGADVAHAAARADVGREGFLDTQLAEDRAYAAADREVNLLAAPTTKSRREGGPEGAAADDEDVVGEMRQARGKRRP